MRHGNSSKGPVAYVWHAGRYASTVQAPLESVGFEIRSQIIWSKDRFALYQGHYHWMHELCWYAVRGSAHWMGERSQNTLWNIKSREDSGHAHSTQKPVECMRRPILNHTKQGELVYDPFFGSGTTLVAAELAAPTSFAALGVFLVALVFLGVLPFAASAGLFRGFSLLSHGGWGAGFWGRCHDAFSFGDDYRGEDIDHSGGRELQD